MMRYRLLFLLLLICLLFPVSSVLSIHATTIAEQPKKEIVYITRTGLKYHRATCRYVTKSKIKIVKREAIRNGYEACKVCKP